MMDQIRRALVGGGHRRGRALWIRGLDADAGRRRRATVSGWESLERRELLSTTQTFDGGGTNFVLQQIGGPPAAEVTPGGPSGNFLRLATTPGSAAAGNNNAIGFVQSDGGTFNTASAAWDFRVTQTTPGLTGIGMSFALLNTANYGTSGTITGSTQPQQGIYDGSLAFGFDTTADTVYLSFKGAVVTATNLTGQLDLASGQFIHAAALVDFQNGAVTLLLTPTTGSAVTVFDQSSVAALGPYSSRIGMQAQNSTTSWANFDIDNINVVYSGQRLPGTISFSSANYAANENDGTAKIDIVRTGGTAGSFTVVFVTADGTAQHGLNYISVSGPVTLGEGVTDVTVSLPVLDDRIYDSSKTVNLYLSNPSVTAPIAPPIVATLTILNTDAPPPTVSTKVQVVRTPGTRMVTGFRLRFSEPMFPTFAEDLSNYQVQIPSARKNGPVRTISLASAVLDPTGFFVTLSRADVGRVHLSKYVRIVVRGRPASGLLSVRGTFLAGRSGESGTDASLIVRI